MTNPDPNEQRLREALGTMNELQPPTDELFVQRAVIRGRARTARRRTALVGIAAAVVVVAGGGGTWWAVTGLGQSSSTSASAGAAREAAKDAAGQGSTAGSQGLPAPVAPPATAGGPALAATGAPGWFVGPMTAQRAAIESLAPQLSTTWAATFSGAWASDDTNTSVVVALIRADPALETLVRTTVPQPGDVRFVVAEHSFADKSALADTIRQAADGWRAQGVTIESVAQDFRADRVVVAASGADAAVRLTSRYGADWVTVTTLPELSGGATR